MERLRRWDWESVGLAGVLCLAVCLGVLGAVAAASSDPTDSKEPTSESPLAAPVYAETFRQELVTRWDGVAQVLRIVCKDAGKGSGNYQCVVLYRTPGHSGSMVVDVNEGYVYRRIR